VIGAARKQAAQLALGPGPVEAAPDDRVEAGVQVPLPGVVAGARPRVAVGHAVPVPLYPVAAEGLLGDPKGLGADGWVPGGTLDCALWPPRSTNRCCGPGSSRCSRGCRAWLCSTPTRTSAPTIPMGHASRASS